MIFKKGAIFGKNGPKTVNFKIYQNYYQLKETILSDLSFIHFRNMKYILAFKI